MEQDICAFCNKKYKKSKGRQAPLVRGEKKNLIEALAEYLDVVKDSEFFKSLSNEPPHLFYHKICRVEYFNKFKSNPTADTKFNLNRELHKEADDEIDQFIQKNIIARGNCFFLISLGEIYDDILKKLYEDRGYSYDGSCNLQHLLNKILDKFSDEIKVSAFRNKNVILPKNKFIDDGLFSLLQEDEILQKAAFILRRRILNIEKKPLSSNVKLNELLAGECMIDRDLINFYVMLLSGARNRRKNTPDLYRKVNSIAADTIYAVTNGNMKPGKHITLGMAMKSLTSSRKVIDILNKYGHCCSYHVLEELETEAAFSPIERTQECPEGITLASNLNTGVAFDNFDRFVETTSGKDTLHDTVGLCIENRR